VLWIYNAVERDDSQKRTLKKNLQKISNRGSKLGFWISLFFCANGAVAFTSWQLRPGRATDPDNPVKKWINIMLKRKVEKMMNKKDMKIIEMLKENCRTPAKEIGRRTGIPITTVCNRMRALERDGIIKNYRAVIDNRKIGKGVEAFIRIDVKRDPEEIVNKFAGRPEVEECYVVSGSVEVMLKVAMPSVDELHDFVAGLKSKNIQKINTQVILRNVERAKNPLLML
jgi:Lrp/AsnC family leucine-responsive transcriptional regulator